MEDMKGIVYDFNFADGHLYLDSPNRLSISFINEIADCETRMQAIALAMLMRLKIVADITLYDFEKEIDLR